MGFKTKALTSIAASGFQASGVMVYHSPPGRENPEMMNKFKTHGLQIAMGVPWRIDEPVVPMKTFRMGLFGLDKLSDIQQTVDVLEEAMDKVFEECESDSADKQAA